MVKTPPKKVFWDCFEGLNPFSGGNWTLRVCFIIVSRPFRKEHKEIFCKAKAGDQIFSELSGPEWQCVESLPGILKPVIVPLCGSILT